MTIARQTLHQGVHLDEQVHTDFIFTCIMSDMTDDIRKTYSEDSFRRLFWEQQLQALKVSNKNKSTMASSTDQVVSAFEM